jgi:hypothetical protein
MASASVDTQASTFSAPIGFTPISGTTNLSSLKAYYRDVTGEWAPSGTVMNGKPMLRCEYNGASTVGINASAVGWSVITVQCNTWRNVSPSIIWYAKVGGNTEIQMAPGGNSYVAPSQSQTTAITFGPGIYNAFSGVVESATRQTQVSFSLAAITGETERWYNGFKAPQNTTLFDAYQTQQPCLGAAGDVFLQCYITIHRFSELTTAKIQSIENNTYTTIGDGSGSTTPYFCTTATNKCGGAKFGEFSVVPNSMTAEELLSLGADIANKWCIPYTGPSIKKFRIVNTGNATIRIGWIGLFKSAFDIGLSANTNMLTLVSPTTISVSSGATLSGSWSTASTTGIGITPHQDIPANEYIEFTLNSVVSNCGFIQFGKLNTLGQVKLKFDVQCNSTVTTWEEYNLWYHYNGVAKEGTTSDAAPINANGTFLYAKDGMLMPWKVKYGSNAGATSPYYIPRYQAALESSASQLATWSANLMSPTWDGDRAIKYYETRKSDAGSMTENRTLDFEQLASVSGGQSVTDGVVSTTGQYNISGRIKATRIDFLPIADQRANNYGLKFEETRSGDAHNCIALACMDPLTFTAPLCSSVFRGDRIPVNTRLRRTITSTPRWYIDVPVGWDNNASTVQDANNSTNYASPHMHGFPRGIAHRATRQLFNYSGPDPVIGRIIDNLDSQKMYTICSWVGNCSPLFSKVTYNGGVTCGDVGAILTRGDVTSDTLVATVNSSVCTAMTLQNLGKREMDSNGNLSAFVAPTYRALRTCTTHGGSFSTNNDAKNFTNSSAERLFIVTVVVNTQANGGSFDSDTKLQDYVQVYLNGKRINTTARKTVPGSSWTTITSSITPGGNYPSYSYNSAALTYGITQVNEYTSNPRTYRTKHPMIASTNTSGGANGIGRSIQNNIASSASGFGLRVQYANGIRMILMETKNECRSTQAYDSATEVAAHIEGLSTKWGLPMAYRWITIGNPAGAPTFRFQRLGLYASHSEAHADASGTTVDSKMSAFTNIMKGYTTATLNSVNYNIGVVSASGVTFGNGVTLTSVLSNTTSSIPSNTEGLEIVAGGSITIDLGDSLTCSHLRFGGFYAASSADYANVRLTVKVTATVPDSELPGTTYECDLKAAKNAAGLTEGQFPLHAGPIVTKDTQFITSVASSGSIVGTQALLLDASIYSGSGQWLDTSTNGRDGTLNNGTVYAGGAFVFDGTDDSVTGIIPASIFSQGHTIACWFNTDPSVGASGAWHPMFANGIGSNSVSIFRYTATKHCIGANNAGLGATSIELNLGADHYGTWIYGAIVYSNATNGSVVTVYAYKNGSLLSTSGSLYWNLATTSTYAVGNGVGGNSYKGSIAHVTVYPKALTQAEFTQNYNALASRYMSGLHVNGSGVYALVPSGSKVPLPDPAAYVAPDTLSDLILKSPGLQAQIALVGCTVKLSKVDFLPSSISVTNVTVHLFDSVSAATTAGTTKPGSPNCTVTSYGFVDGVITFTATPTMSGNDRILVVFVDKPVGASGAATVAIADNTGRTVQTFPWQNYILYQQARTTNPGWQLQLPSFARLSGDRLSTDYTNFVRATFDNTLFKDGAGTQWSSSTGSTGNMILKSEYFSQDDTRLINNMGMRLASTMFAPIGPGFSALTGDNNLSYNQFLLDTTTNAVTPFVRWGYKYSVTATYVGLCLFALASWSGTSLTLRGFTSNAFSSGVILATIPCNNIGVNSTSGMNYTWFTLTTTGSYSHYELRATTGQGSYTWPVILA